MAATRLIALHINKGKTVAQCLADRTDYSQNAAKTNDGEFISSYECDPKTADEEFLLTKRQYQHITGRQQKHDVIAYQIRQSFKQPKWAMNWRCDLPRENMLFLLPLTSTKHISTTTSFLIPLRLTEPENLRTFFYLVWQFRD